MEDPFDLQPYASKESGPVHVNKSVFHSEINSEYGSGPCSGQVEPKPIRINN